MYTVYILRTSGDTLYTGQTNDLDKRLKKHTQGTGSKYVRSFENFELVYTEKFENISGAMKREAEIKKMTKENKEKLVSSGRRGH